MRVVRESSRRAATALLVAALGIGYPVRASGQSVLERSPNLHGSWGLDPGHVLFVFAHRFESVSGGEIFSVPTFTLGLGVPFVTLGVDFTTFSESIPGEVTGNEFQWWVKRPFRITRRVEVSAIGGYNATASSFDGALSGRWEMGRFQLFGEGRAFSRLFGSDGAAAGAVGGAVRLTDYLALTSDVGRVLTTDSVPTAWSAAAAVQIPLSPHTFSLQVTNTGATTLHGASRKKTIGSSDVRYGFAFTVPFGNRSRWTRIFGASRPPPAPAATVGARSAIVAHAFAPEEIRIRAGEAVEWTNLDPVGHTIVDAAGGWRSGEVRERGTYRRTFDTAGVFEYYCEPHPEMRGRVVVVP